MRSPDPEVTSISPLRRAQRIFGAWRAIYTALSTRCVHVADNAAQIGTHVKGRSSSRRLNKYCRRA
eukprot:12669377-Heterocapsa_arctica.AAC.1